MSSTQPTSPKDPVLDHSDPPARAAVHERASMTSVFVALWLVAVFLSAWFDVAVSRWVHLSGNDALVKGTWFAAAIKFGGTFWLLGIVAIILLFAHPLRWRAAVFLLLCGVVSGINGLVKWVVGRTRPDHHVPPFEFHWFRGGWVGLFHEKNLSFPSGHACLAFAMAAGLAILLPRWRWAFYAAATLVAVERVAESAHYLSDTVGAAAIGVIGVWILAAICAKCVHRTDV